MVNKLCLLFLLISFLPAKGQNGWYLCLSAGNAHGDSYAFLSKPFIADTILNRKEKVSDQFKQELMLSHTLIYSRNARRFEEIQVEILSSEFEAKKKHDFLLSTLNHRGFKVFDLPFHFYADSVQRILNYTTLDDDNRLLAISNALSDAKIKYQTARAELEKTKEFENRKNAAKNNWVEKKPGVCKAGGAPPICKENHWLKTDNVEAKFAYEIFINRRLIYFYKPMVELENEYKEIALRGRSVIDRTAADSAAKPTFYFCKAHNVGLRQVVAGDIFSSKLLVANSKAVINIFVSDVAEAYPYLYKSGEQTIYNLSEAHPTRAQALAKRRAYLAYWKYIYNYQAFFLAEKWQ